jgi:hypothetical protein
VRDYVNEGGRVFYNGQAAGQQYTPARGTQLYDPFENRQCRPDRGSVRRRRHRQSAHRLLVGVQRRPERQEPSHQLVIHRDGRLPQSDGSVAQLPAVRELAGGGIPERSLGTLRSTYRQVVHVVGPRRRGVQAPDADDRRPRGRRTLSFWTSYNLEQDFDYMIVEAHTVGQDDWTTLPDQNGHTTSDLSNDLACTGGWSNPDDPANVLHPFLTHYQTFDPATGTCSPTGDDGSVERRERQLERLAAAAVRSLGLRGQAGGGLDHVGERLGLPAVPGRVRRRHRDPDRGGQHVVRGRR